MADFRVQILVRAQIYGSREKHDSTKPEPFFTVTCASPDPIRSRGMEHSSYDE